MGSTIGLAVESDVHTDEALPGFMAERPRLFGIAYRMLGSVVEAEDVLQDAWLRWQRIDRTAVLNVSGFLTTLTTRLAINAAQSAHARRRSYIGPWLPEPVDTRADPTLGAERAEVLEFAVLRLLEALNPKERAAYVLREAFDYSYEQIAEMLQISEANTRQLVSRSRRHIADGRRTPVDPSEQRRLLEAFVSAAQQGDTERLTALFAEDICSYSDGNGAAQVARKPVLGRPAVTKFTAGFRSRLWTNASVSWVEANGQACVLVHRDGVTIGLGTVHGSAMGIDYVMWMMNLAKIDAITRASRTS